MDIKSFKKKFDILLKEYTKKKSKQAKKIARWHNTAAYIDYIESVIFAGGKRIRPYLIYISYKMHSGYADNEVMRFAMASELIHTMALIHDDIIDKGTLRHNVPCMHTYVADFLGSKQALHVQQQRDVKHNGISQAILVGDLIFARAYDVLYQDYTIEKNALRAAQSQMQYMIEEVVSGQMLDVDSMVTTAKSYNEIDEKNSYKSGQYTFARPLIVGALLAGKTLKECKDLEKIGTILGKAYQLRDDLLDILVEDESNVKSYDNKTKFSDIQDGQQTFLTNYIVENGKHADRLLLKNAFGRRLSQKDIQAIRSMFVNSGAIAYGKEMIKKYTSQAIALIEKNKQWNSEYKEFLIAIAHMLHVE